MNDQNVLNEVFHILTGEQEIKRFYVATSCINGGGELLGVFSNRKILLGAIQQVGIPKNAYIKGMRAKRPVNISSVATGFFNKNLKIFATDENDNEKLIFNIWEITQNKLNPKYIQKD